MQTLKVLWPTTEPTPSTSSRLDDAESKVKDFILNKVPSISRCNRIDRVSDFRDLLEFLPEPEKSKSLIQYGFDPPMEIRDSCHTDPDFSDNLLWRCCLGPKCRENRKYKIRKQERILISVESGVKEYLKRHGVFTHTPGTQLFICILHLKLSGDKSIVIPFLENTAWPWQIPKGAAMFVSGLKNKADPQTQVPWLKDLDNDWADFLGYDRPHKRYMTKKRLSEHFLAGSETDPMNQTDLSGSSITAQQPFPKRRKMERPVKREDLIR